MRVLRPILRFLQRRPFAVGMALLVLGVAAATGGPIAMSDRVRQLIGSGYRSVVDLGHWWAPLTSSLIADTVTQLGFAVLGILVLVGAAERLMGAARTAVAFVVTAFVGTGAGLLIQFAGIAAGDEFWAAGVRDVFVLDPFTPILGALIAATSFAGPLWRRRIRVLVLLAVLLYLLYSGQPADLYRLAAVLSGLLLGRLYRPHPIRLGWPRSSHHEARTLVASAIAVLALGPVITVFTGAIFGPLAPLGLLLTTAAPNSGQFADRCLAGAATEACLRELALERASGLGPVLVTLLPLVTLLVAAYGLLRGQRFAAWLSITVNLGLAALAAYFYGFLPISGQPYVIGVNSGRYWEVLAALIVSILVPVGTAALAAVNLRHFPFPARPGAVRRFVVVVVAVLLLLSAAFLGIGWLLRSSFRPVLSFSGLLAELPERFVPVGFLRVERTAAFPTDVLASLLYQAVGPLFWITVIVAALLVLRVSPLSAAHGEQARMRAILRSGGRSLSYLITWPGNAYWFSADGSTVIAYRVLNGIAITTADPVGPRDAAEQAVRDFAVFCDDHSWTPVFYSVHDDWQAFFTGLGWQTTAVAEETVLRPHTWTTTGKKWQDVRTSVNRAVRAGIRSEWASFRSLPRVLSSQITEISEQWVAEKNLPEMGFTLGGVDELHDPSVRLMVAIDAEDRVQAVTSWLPTYRGGVVIGWTLDFMRRRPGGLNGVMEFLIAQTAELMRADPRIEFLSLSAAPLASSHPAPEDGLVSRVLGYLGSALEPVYGFRSLFAFKRKFQPEFHPLLMAYPDASALPGIGIALARAYLPDLSFAKSVQFVRSLS